MLVDQMFHQRRQGCYELTRIHHADGHVLRVRVYRDSYVLQSSAVVEVLTPQRTWTTLATAPWTQQLHESTPLYAADPTSLASIADGLVERACRILTPPLNGGTAAVAASQ
jgi:hypothetical protein